MLMFNRQHKYDMYYHLTFLAFLFILWWKVLPLYMDLFHTFSFYHQEKKRLESSLTLQQKGELIRKKLRNMENKLVGRLESTSAGYSLSETLTQIQKISKKEKIQLIELKPGAGGESEFYTIVPISITLKGSFISGMNFIRGMESRSTLFRIRTIEIDSENPFLKNPLRFEVFIELYLRRKNNKYESIKDS